ncbi:MAG: enoyl-CoA hydratase/isomerase family protein [Halieaceae bacterium]|nr:enoyl-CoA hydratase/isomerase family protein [Halieaceae bacterium]
MNSVKYRVDGDLAHIVLGRDPVNALSIEFLDDILAALTAAGADDAVRAIIISSDIPDRFSAGLDIEILLGKSSDEIRDFLDRLYVQLWDVQCGLGKPSIAAVGGAARGGGMTLAISCDLIVAAESATFGYPEIDLGLLPAIHLSHLPRLIGRPRAFELLFSARTFSAVEAERIGLVNRCTSDSDLLRSASEMAAVFASKPPDAIRAARSALVRASDRGYRDDIAMAVDDFCTTATSASTQKKLRSFLEKRRSS